MKFKCKHSGNVYEFLEEQDIVSMKVHPDYEVVVEEAPKEDTQEKTTSKKSS